MTTNLINDRRAAATRRPPLNAATRISAFGPTAQAPTAVFEAVFRSRLAELAGRPEPTDVAPQRSTITLVVTALRSAAEVDQVLDLVRGVSAAELSAAYHFVAAIRLDADQAWETFLTDPTIECFRRLDTRIRRLLPQPAAELREAMVNAPSQFDERVETITELIRALDRRVVDIEARLSLSCPEARASELDDGGAGIFHQPHYRPVRLGDLMPLRLANLLGESVQAGTDRRDDRAALPA